MKQHTDLYSVERMAAVLGVSRSYKYIQEKQSPPQEENDRLRSLIQEAYEESFGLYGSPRLHAV